MSVASGRLRCLLVFHLQFPVFFDFFDVCLFPGSVDVVYVRKVVANVCVHVLGVC